MSDKQEEKNGKNGSEFKSKVYVITAAQAVQSEEHEKKYGHDSIRGAPNENLMRGLLRYCKERGAELKILSMVGMNFTETKLNDYFSERCMKGEGEVLYSMRQKERSLNQNIKISGMVEPPQNIDIPNTRDRFVQRDQSVVMAHTKQRLRCVPTGNKKFPKLITTTGCCTHPNYNIDRSNSSGNRRADIALRDHQYGAVVVEVVSPFHYNLRHIPAQVNGKFVDMGKMFNGGRKPTKVGIEALVLGDLHVGEIDEKVMTANYEMIDFFKPKRLFIHDLANSDSVNPHEKDDCISRAIKARLGKLDLENELEECYRVLCRLGKAMGKNTEILVVPSNHDNFIYRYLALGEFPHDPINAGIASYLNRIAVEECNDPAEAANVVVEEGIKKIGNLPSNIRFLRFEDDYEVWGYQLANHGHLGHSGARGSTRSQELMYGKSVTGHTHSPEILRDTIVVGTSSRLDLAYTRGQGSKWMAANAVLYEGGFIQLLPIINGKWLMKK